MPYFTGARIAELATVTEIYDDGLVQLDREAITLRRYHFPDGTSKVIALDKIRGYKAQRLGFVPADLVQRDNLRRTVGKVVAAQRDRFAVQLDQAVVVYLSHCRELRNSCPREVRHRPSSSRHCHPCRLQVSV